MLLVRIPCSIGYSAVGILVLPKIYELIQLSYLPNW